jgi:cysteinyl-tRNA synthetase
MTRCGGPRHLPRPAGHERGEVVIDSDRQPPSAPSRAGRPRRLVMVRDTRSGRVRPIEPRVPDRIGIYACGPTVYGPVHVGNARPFVVYSLLRRFLVHEGYDVVLVINITDINDKVYAAARAAGVSSPVWADRMTDAYVRDTDRLGLGRPDYEPRASHSIDRMICLITRLIESGHAYIANGDVYFHVRSHPTYGEISHRDVDEMDPGEGLESAHHKHDPLDFALWKAQKPGEDTAWESPWGRGRPGWHIECSAMGEEILGLGFDIHGGGSDLVFPHHENEAAQTRAARGEPLAKLWMHNGMIRLHDAKMAKSAGNILPLREALDRYGRDALIMYLCGAHYRQPMDFDDAQLRQASARVRRVQELHRHVTEASSPSWSAPLRERFFTALADDFNTPRALAAVFDWVAEANRGRGVGAADLREMLDVLGLANLLQSEALAIPGDVLALARLREQARAQGDFTTADRIRAELHACGWGPRDHPDGTELVAFVDVEAAPSTDV